MLATLAALVPIIASIYVGGSFLGEYTRQNHQARVFERITAWERDCRAALWSLAMPDERRSRLGHELTARRQMLLELNGLDRDLGAVALFNQLGDPAPVSAIDQRRQWVLLIGASLGVVFLALDLATSAVI